jgi:hypothetical protein
MGAIPLKLEKAMLKKAPGGGGGGLLDDAASMATSVAADLAGASGMIPTTWTDDSMPFKFNPDKFVESSSASTTSRPTPASNTGHQLQYTGSSPKSLDFTIFLDEWEAPAGQDVSGMVAHLHKLTAPKRGSDPPTPPKVVFIWGKYQFKGIVKSVSATYTLFRRDGTPARAEVHVQMTEQADDNEQAQNPTSGGPPGRRSFQLVDGDSLQSLAYREYGDPNLWRAIAEANGIDDPLGIVPGRHLLLPSKRDARGLR